MNTNIQEKFGQMIMLGLDTTEINDEIIKLIKDYKIGGVVLYKSLYSSIQEMVEVINKLKTANKNNIPLFIAIDQENGRVNRFPPEIKRILSPYKQASTKNIEIINKTNKITTEILKELGINMNFAPVLDIDSYNKAIGNRSYGKTKEEVIKYALPMIKTLQESNIISVVKHFPGHGLVEGDTHYLLPTIKNITKMEEDLEVYKEAIKNSVDSIMIGHLRVSGYGLKPATINKDIIDKYLINRYNYQGLIITDDLRMNIIKNIYGLKNVINYSINAGNNILMIKYKKDDTKKLYNKLYQMLEDGIINLDLINNSYDKIIKIKDKYKINNNLIKNKLDIETINNQIEKLNKEIEKGMEE